MITKFGPPSLVVVAGGVLTIGVAFSASQIAQHTSKVSVAPMAAAKKSPTPHAAPPPKALKVALKPAPSDAPMLAPGVTSPRKLAVSNTNNQDVILQAVQASVTNPEPGSTSGLQCSSPTDISVQVVPGQLPIEIRKNSSKDIDVEIVMQNTNQNQDDCKGRTFSFAFTATATSK